MGGRRRRLCRRCFHRRFHRRHLCCRDRNRRRRCFRATALCSSREEGSRFFLLVRKCLDSPGRAFHLVTTACGGRSTCMLTTSASSPLCVLFLSLRRWCRCRCCRHRRRHWQGTAVRTFAEVQAALAAVRAAAEDFERGRAGREAAAGDFSGAGAAGAAPPAAGTPGSRCASWAATPPAHFLTRTQTRTRAHTKRDPGCIGQKMTANCGCGSLLQSGPGRLLAPQDT